MKEYFLNQARQRELPDHDKINAIVGNAHNRNISAHDASFICQSKANIEHQTIINDYYYN